MRWKIFLLILSLLISSSVMGTELEEIRKAIRQKGAKWTAGETSISKLSPEERRRLCGAIREERKPRGLRTRGEELPDVSKLSQLDWRNHNGHNWTTPIRDQKNCGSCVAFGTVAALEANIKIYANNHWLPPDLSEQHLFSCGRGPGGCEYGWYVSAAMDYLENYGTPDETCLPYIAVDDNCFETCFDWQARARKISDWGWTYSDVSSIKSYLTVGALAARMDVYTDFFYYHSGVYQHVSGVYEGGHIITIVGWDDSEDCWICENSWGKDWGEDTYGVTGERGWFRIKRGDCGIEDGVAWLIPISKGPDGMVLDKDSFHFALPPDSSDSDALQISNVGDSTFIFHIAINQPWLFVSPQSDTLDSNEVSLLDISVSSSGSLGGVYPGTLSVYARDPGSGEVPLYRIDVSVTLDVNPPFVRGDVDASGGYTLGDGLFFLKYFFSGFPTPLCGDACDVDDSGNLTSADGLYFLNYFFVSSPAIPPPSGSAPDACGFDPTEDDLDCGSFPPCGAKAKVVVSAPLVSVKGASEKVVVKDAEVEDGEVVVPVELVNVEDITGVDITLGYNASTLEAVKVDGGADYDYFVGYTEDAGKVRIGIVSDLELKDAIEAGERVIAEVVFKVNGSLSSDVEITVESADLYGRGVKQVKSEWIGGLVRAEVGLPTESALHQNYPNPFNPVTLIRYQLSEDCWVTLEIYNPLGQKVRTLVNGEKKANYYTVYWDGRDAEGNEVSSGIYFHRLQAGKFSQTKKMMILR